MVLNSLNIASGGQSTVVHPLGLVGGPLRIPKKERLGMSINEVTVFAFFRFSPSRIDVMLTSLLSIRRSKHSWRSFIATWVGKNHHPRISSKFIDCHP